MNDKHSFVQVHLTSCKFSLGVHSKTSDLAKQCEFSRYPILISILQLVHNYYYRLNKLPSDRLLHKLYPTDKQLLLKGNTSPITNIRHMEKLLNVQTLESYSKSGFINILKTLYKNRLVNNRANIHIKEPSDSKLELISTLYDNSKMPCYLNMNFSKDKTYFHCVFSFFFSGEHKARKLTKICSLNLYPFSPGSFMVKISASSIKCINTADEVLRFHFSPSIFKVVYTDHL